MTTALELTLGQVRAKIHRLRLSPQSEDSSSLNDVAFARNALVEPILNALGWDMRGGEDVRRDFKPGEGGGKYAYAVFLAGDPRLLVRVRTSEVPPERADTTARRLRRASSAGFEWVVTTDGDWYCIHNAHAELPIEERLFDAVRITDDREGRAARVLGLLSRESVERNLLRAEWRRHRVERQLCASLQELFAPDESLVRLLQRRTRNLSTEEIRGSLARAGVNVSFAAERQTRNASHQARPSLRPRPRVMSDAELRIATWLQRRSIDRWGKGESVERENYRRRSRRALAGRRSTADRRSQPRDRRLAQLAAGDERRAGIDRRRGERRTCTDRRVRCDRRLAGSMG